LDHDYFPKPSQNGSRQEPQVSDDGAELKKEKGDDDDEELGVSYLCIGPSSIWLSFQLVL